jgi:hypothetical protein
MPKSSDQEFSAGGDDVDDDMNDDMPTDAEALYGACVDF